MSGFGQFAASSQFYLYGKKNFTRVGYAKHVKEYEQPDPLSTSTYAGGYPLSEHVFMITGANSGIGREVAQYLAGRDATVYLVCRSRPRAEVAVAEITSATGNSRVHILEGDMGVERDVRRCMQEFAVHSGAETPRLDALFCNAGAQLNEKTMTSEGIEATFASHLLFGTYLIGCLAMPWLEATPGSRFIAMSTGGIYNVPFPDWDVATSTYYDPKAVYNGQLAFAYANRGKVLLCERWAEEFPGVKVVSCHPGWTDTPFLHGDTKKLLEPMRTPWEGAEGVAWLCVAPSNKITSGAFYLDRKPQVKHMAGPFFTEGSYTKNSPAQIQAMMSYLDDWSNGRRPRGESLFHRGKIEGPLCPLERPMELTRFMGRWYVVAEYTPKTERTVNHMEEYVYDEGRQTVMVDFSYCDSALTKTSHVLQDATVVNDFCTEWNLIQREAASFGFVTEPTHYIIAHLAEDYSSAIVGVPDRSHIAIMTRVADPNEATVQDLMKRAEALGYDLGKISAIVQDWSKGDLVARSEMDDSFLA